MLEDQTSESANPNGYDEVVFTRNAESFSLLGYLHKSRKGLYMGMHQHHDPRLWTEDGALPQGLTIQNAYTELQKGSKYVVIVVRNSTAYPQMLQKKAPVARAMSATMVLEIQPEIRVQEGEDEPQDPHPPNLTIRQRQGKLFKELDSSGLNSWPLELAEATCQLLAEYHDVFWLEPTELGCTHSTEHTIKVTDDTPFKE